MNGEPRWWRDPWTWFLVLFWGGIFAAGSTRDTAAVLKWAINNISYFIGYLGATILVLAILFIMIAPYERHDLRRKEHIKAMMSLDEGRLYPQHRDISMLEHIASYMRIPFFAAIALVVVYCLYAAPHEAARAISWLRISGD